MPKVLGRITTDSQAARGPDAMHRIQVTPEWLHKGAIIEFELPRNLTCAACEGGGCDVCGRSGAISVRERKAPAELVEVTLPARDPEAGNAPVILRIPEQGGLADEASGLPRGMLLLRVIPDAKADANVRRLRPTMPPPEIEVAADAHAPRSSTATLILALLFVLLLALAVLLGRL